MLTDFGVINESWKKAIILNTSKSHLDMEIQQDSKDVQRLCEFCPSYWHLHSNLSDIIGLSVLLGSNSV